MIEIAQIDTNELNDVYCRLANIVELEDVIKLSGVLAGKCITFKRSYDIENDYKSIVDCVGVVKAKKIIQGFSGEHVYFSSIKKALKKQAHELIRKDFNGYNYNQLAEKYGYTSRYIRNVVSQKP